MNTSLISQRLVEAALNGGGQGIVLTVLVALCLRCFPGINAATRHAVWFVTLLVVAALPVVHFILEPLGDAATSSDRRPDSSELGPAASPRPYLVPESKATPTPTPTHPLLLEEFSGADVLAPNPNVPDEVGLSVNAFRDWTGAAAQMDSVPVSPELQNVEISGRDQADEGRSSTEAAIHTAVDGRQQAEDPSYDYRRSFGPSFPKGWRIQLSQQIAAFLVLAWAAVALIRLGNLTWECVQLRWLKRRASGVSDELQAFLTRIQQEMGMKRGARLMIGQAAEVPLVAGFWRPAVVLPMGFLDSTSQEQLGLVLRHELAHLLRGDDWSNIIQQFMKAILFFHPAIWWITEQLSLEREIACDDHVLAAIPRPRPYALLLTDFAGRRQSRDLIAAPAVWNKKTQLKERIAMILDSKRNSSPRLVRTLAGALALGIAGFTGIVLHAAPRLALEDQTRDSVASEAAVTDVTTTDVTTEATPVPEIAANEEAEPAPQVNSPDVVPPENGELAVTAASDSSGPRPKPTPRIEAWATSTSVPTSLALPAVPAVPPIAIALPRAGDLPVPVGLTIARTADVRFSDDANDADGERSSGSAGPKSHRKTGDKDKGDKGEKGDNASLERRLERLERMMERFMSGRGAQVDRQPSVSRNRDLKLETDPKVIAKLNEDGRKLARSASRMGLSETEITELRILAEKNANQAADAAKSATVEIQREQAKLAEHFAEIGRRSELTERRRLELQREALESTHRSLEKQMEELERRLERLDKQTERQQERDGQSPKKSKGAYGGGSQNRNNDSQEQAK